MAEFSTYWTRLKDSSHSYTHGLYRQLTKKNIFLWAQAIAFKVLITIVPVIILATGVLGQVLQREKPFESVANMVRNFLPTEQSEEIINALNQLSNAGDFFTIVGVLALLFSAMTLFTTLRVTVGNVFQEEWHENRSILRGYLFDLRMVGQVGLFFLLSLGLSFFVQRMRAAGYDFIAAAGLDAFRDGWGWTVNMLGVLIPFLITTAMFFQLFYFVPKPHPPKQSALFGAFIAATLWEGAKAGFTVYATHVGRFDRYSGEGAGNVLGSTFGLIIAFVFWIYYSGIVLCLGAILTLLHEKRHRSRRMAALAEATEEDANAPFEPEPVGTVPAEAEAARHATTIDPSLPNGQPADRPPDPSSHEKKQEDLSVN
ncbi:MAG: YihY/virulence factor BrkB family protein [Rhodothermales bacterium]